MAVLLQAGLHNKYCVKKARWEEHLRTVQEEEEIITEMYREYKVNSHNSKFMQKAFSSLKAASFTFTLLSKRTRSITTLVWFH